MQQLPFTMIVDVKFCVQELPSPGGLLVNFNVPGITALHLIILTRNSHTCILSLTVFCSAHPALTLKNGGNVLVPCYPSGVTYDLFECLSGHLDSLGLGQVPMYFISPVSASSLAYSNIYAEWWVKIYRVSVAVEDSGMSVHEISPPMVEAEIDLSSGLLEGSF